MKKYEYFLSIGVLIKGFLFFGFCFFFGFYIEAKKCGGESCTFALLFDNRASPLLQLATFGCFLFLLLGSWRYLVRFQKYNNQIILTNDEIIIPGSLQIFSEKKINLKNVEKIEKKVIGNNENILIKISFADGRKEESISWNNCMTIEKFDELYFDLKKAVEK